MTGIDPKRTVTTCGRMAMQTHLESVRVRNDDGLIETAEIEWWVDSTHYPDQRRASNVRVTLLGKSKKRAASDFFEAFQKAREPFESRGYRFLCYGASENVWPSNMARDMGAGMKAYKLFMDQKPSRDDLVSIFDSGEDIVPSTVAEQCAFANSWYCSRTDVDKRAPERRWWEVWK